MLKNKVRFDSIAIWYTYRPFAYTYVYVSNLKAIRQREPELYILLNLFFYISTLLRKFGDQHCAD